MPVSVCVPKRKPVQLDVVVRPLCVCASRRARNGERLDGGALVCVGVNRLVNVCASKPNPATVERGRLAAARVCGKANNRHTRSLVCGINGKKRTVVRVCGANPKQGQDVRGLATKPKRLLVRVLRVSRKQIIVRDFTGLNGQPATSERTVHCPAESAWSASEAREFLEITIRRQTEVMSAGRQSGRAGP